MNPNKNQSRAMNAREITGLYASCSLLTQRSITLLVRTDGALIARDANDANR
jgi:hypothetical protein